MTTCKDCFFPAELSHDCSGDMGDLQTTRTVVQFTRRELYARDKFLREQIARDIMSSNVNVFMTTPETIRAHYAAIARGGVMGSFEFNLADGFDVDEVM